MHFGRTDGFIDPLPARRRSVWWVNSATRPKASIGNVFGTIGPRLRSSIGQSRRFLPVRLWVRLPPEAPTVHSTNVQ